MLTSSSTETGNGIGGIGSGGERGETAQPDKEPSPQLITRPATGKDIVEFYGSSPYSMRALVAELDGKIVGVIGVVREPSAGKFFCDFSDELRPFLGCIKIWRAVKAANEFAKAYRGPIVAVAEHAEGCRNLHRLGWTHLQGELYGWLR